MVEFFVDAWKAFEKAFITGDLYLLYLEGFAVTISIAVIACIIGIAIGLLVTIIKVAPKNNIGMKILGGISNVYTTLMRGTPVVVQLFIAYFVTLTAIKNQGVFGGVIVAIIVFALNSGAYVSEILRGGLMGVDKGQMEAGRSLGLTWSQSMKLIILPQGLKSSIPSLFNEFIALVKETSVVGMVSIMDLTLASKIIAGQTMAPTAPYLIVAVFYLVIILGLQQVQKKLEKKFSKGDRV